MRSISILKMSALFKIICEFSTILIEKYNHVLWKFNVCSKIYKTERICKNNQDKSIKPGREGLAYYISNTLWNKNSIVV